jgi:endonuclease YncB( thermonuclease family)
MGEINTSTYELLDEYTRELMEYWENTARTNRLGVWGLSNHIHPALYRIRNHLSE